MAAFRIDTTELRGLAKAIRSSTPACRAGIRKGVKAAGELVAETARTNAGWSTRIPGSIKTRAASTTAVVSAGSARAPHAAPFEHQGRSGTFRHPVFGHGDRAKWTWVDQQARPFLAPALESRQDEAVDLIGDTVAAALGRWI